MHRARANLYSGHRGLFWWAPVPLVEPRHRMLSLLVESSLSLFAAHLPLDAHPEVGNNARLAALLGLSETRPFGWYRGVPLGVWGTLDHPVSVQELLGRFPGVNEAVTLLPFGPEEIRTVGVVSGSASSGWRKSSVWVRICASLRIMHGWLKSPKQGCLS